jgi:hypothetical protein
MVSVTSKWTPDTNTDPAYSFSFAAAASTTPLLVLEHKAVTAVDWTDSSWDDATSARLKVGALYGSGIEGDVEYITPKTRIKEAPLTSVLSYVSELWALDASSGNLVSIDGPSKCSIPIDVPLGGTLVSIEAIVDPFSAAAGAVITMQIIEHNANYGAFASTQIVLTGTGGTNIASSGAAAQLLTQSGVDFPRVKFQGKTWRAYFTDVSVTGGKILGIRYTFTDPGFSGR